MLKPRLVLGLITVLLPVAAATTEVICALGSAGSAYKPSEDQRPSADTMQIVRRVNDTFKPFCAPKCPEAAMFRNTTAANLMLTVNQDGGKLVYTPVFFSTVYGKYGDAGIMALMAHVYGHAIDETIQPTWMPGNWNLELRADAWSGCVLAKAGQPASGVTSALGALAAYPPAGQSAAAGQTGWSRRLPAVRLGYTHCGGEAAKFDGASTGTKVK